MVRILHDDWPIRSGENRPDQSSQPNKHFVGMLVWPPYYQMNITEQKADNIG